MSTIRVTNIDPPSAGGAVNVNGVAMPNAGPLSNRNLVVNGGMAVSQRATTESASGSSAYGSVDRFKRSVSGGTTASSQVALTSGSPYDEGFRFAFRYTNTDAVTSTATQHRYLEHKLEAQVMSQSGWNYPSSSSYITLSFWVRASVGQEYYANLRTTDGTAQYYIISTGTLTADTWTKVTKTIPGNSNLTFDNNSDLGLTINWFPFAGTDWTDSGATLDTWAAWDSTARVPDMTTTWGTTAGATFDITGVQLEVGSQATHFEHRSYGDELARCQRYFYDPDGAFADATATESVQFNLGQSGTNSNEYIVPVSFAVPMRIAPAVTVGSNDYGVGTFTTLNPNGNGRLDATISEAKTIGIAGCSLRCRDSTDTGHSGFRGWFYADAEL